MDRQKIALGAKEVFYVAVPIMVFIHVIALDSLIAFCLGMGLGALMVYLHFNKAVV
jgi:hypothetical protein